MITPEEIKQQCLKWWKEVLHATLDGVSFFPRDIPRIGKVQTKNILSNLGHYKIAIDILSEYDKSKKGYGYAVKWEERSFDKIGKNTVPVAITIESLEDYLKITGKSKDYQYFKDSTQLIISTIPKLKDWLYANLHHVIEHRSWSDALKVCTYFLENPKPNLYIRQLPINVHTKYIKPENEALFRSLLDFLVPEHINTEEKQFEKRYHLKYAEPLIRIRFLDRSLSPMSATSDISIPLSEFKLYSCACKNILVTENQMNFLTLPQVKDTIALWSGGGFNVSYLKHVTWLGDKQFYYWGDIDAHGFQILNQFRSYFKNTKALMMDQITLDAYSDQVGKGAKNKAESLSELLPEEQLLYDLIRKGDIRLEQEKIDQGYVENAIFQNPSLMYAS
ncbi:MAG: DUF2220 family protein [Bacteroidia bacterium]|jgi:hypothetical protein|nr:DUF2220 family protein [Bacteroidia bacterium]